MKLTALTVLGVVLILFTLTNSIGGGIAKISPEQAKSGARSGRAGELLVKKGYRVKNLGGFEAAKSAGMVTE